MEVDVGLVAQRDNERAQELAESLATTIEEAAATVVVDEATGERVERPAVPVAAMTDRDFVVSIGGDGTLLFVAREVGGTPILGVNLGEVGFLNAVPPADAIDVATALVTDLQEGGSLTCRELDRLQATGDGWTLEPALNEVVVHGPRRGHGGGATLDVRVDGSRYTKSHADGVLVATPTGSSAYNLSEDGPLVHPAADTLVITQMAAPESMPPLVVDRNADLSLSVTDADTAFVISDGRNRREITPPMTVSIGIADEPVRLVGPQGSFFGGLEKLE